MAGLWILMMKHQYRRTETKKCRRHQADPDDLILNQATLLPRQQRWKSIHLRMQQPMERKASIGTWSARNAMITLKADMALWFNAKVAVLQFSGPPTK